MSMLGKEDASSEGGSLDPRHLSDARKSFWRSASWSSSRSSLPPLNTESDGQSRRSGKARPCLPPLQPLSIARRSLDEWPKASSDDVGEWPVPITPGGRDRLKLDLSTIQRNSEKNVGLVRREKIALFDKECSKVAEDIYLGGDMVAKDRDILKQNGITHILNCVGFACSEYFKADFIYRTLWLQDSPSEDITSILYDVFDYFEDVREQGGRVFVHCCQGVSRSTSLVIAYLMWREGQSFDDAFQYVKAARGIADPNMGFACQLLQCQKRVHAFPLSPSSLLRIYRLAPHSPYDPLHLVPKMLNDPSPSLLDSRGAFIVHVPSAIYVWIGKNCDPIMERDAKGAVCQIVRYEKVQGPINVIMEGEEPRYFWDAFSNFLPLMNKSRNGANSTESPIEYFSSDRKVDTYNVDYEIFHKAIKGGFVPPFSSSDTEHETHLPARENSWSLLRRKFASSCMNNFVTSTKSELGLNNSVTKQLQSSAKLLPSISLSSESSSISSSSSPPYLSPDSRSSDSSFSSKYHSDSPAASPLAAPDSCPQPSAASSSSNFSLRSPSQFITKTSEFIDVNFTTGLRSQSASSSLKKSPLSLAERRGSLSKCLSLPVRVDEPNADRDLFQQRELQKSSCRSDDVSPCCGKATTVETSDQSCKSHRSVKKTSCFTGLLASVSELCNPKRPLIYRWPDFEKIVTFDYDKLDSEVFVFVTPISGVGKMTDRIVYIWVGKSFKCSKSVVSLDGYGNIDDLADINWNQVSSGVLTQLSLPGDTVTKIVKEDEEPPELLALLSPL